MASDKEESDGQSHQPNYEGPPYILGLPNKTEGEKTQPETSDTTDKRGPVSHLAENFWAFMKRELTAVNLFTLVIAVAAIFQFLATQGQLAVMRSQLSDMRRNSNDSATQTDRAIGNMNWLAKEMNHSVQQSQSAMNTGVESARLDQRPWVGVSYPQSVNTGQGISIQALRELSIPVMKNSGRTPAEKVSVISAICGPAPIKLTYSSKTTDG